MAVLPRFVVVLALALAPAASAHAQELVETIDLFTLGGSASAASDVNKHGQIVGWSETANGQTHAFSWTATGSAPSSGHPPAG